MSFIKPSNFDRQGRHWQTHGTNVYPIDQAGVPIAQRVVVHSQFDPSRNKKPIVAATVANGPLGSLELRMASEGARALAHALMNAADLADQVQVELEAGRA
jgi:hypothetical protein